MSRRLSIDVPAERLKSGKESGEKALILLFLGFGRLFHYGIPILYLSAHLEKGKGDVNLRI